MRSAGVVHLAVAVLFAVVPGARAQQLPLKVKVKLGDVSLNKLPFVIAYEEGIYTANGLEVEQQITDGAAAVARRNGVVVPEKYILKKGAPDPPISIGGACPTIVRYTTTPGTPESVILACTDHMVRSHLVSRGDITNPDQLKGKRLGYSGNAATTHLAALSFAQAMGWKPGRDIFLVPGGSIPALKKGDVDAFVASELYETMAVAEGLKDLVDLSRYRMPTAGSSMMADRTWLRSNQETARRLVKSLVQALAAIKQNRNAAVRAMALWYGVQDPKLQENFYRKASLLPRKPYPPYEGLKKMVEFFSNPEMQKHKLEDFYDDTYVRQLDQNGYIDSLYK
jgi:ABC-type nitrate/sulfonate/bicarbonate transport system substrate-binding protein